MIPPLLLRMIPRRESREGGERRREPNGESSKRSIATPSSELQNTIMSPHILTVTLFFAMAGSSAALAPIQSSRRFTAPPDLEPGHQDSAEILVCRRDCIAGLFALVGSTLLPKPAFASETVGKDEACDDASCLGVWDGLFADCPHNGKLGMGSGAGCVSSQDDTPGIFAEPWDYSEAPNNSLDYNDQMRLLKPSIELVCSKRGDTVKYLVENGRYLRVVFTDGRNQEKSVGEFYFTPNDTTLQFRIGSLSPGASFALISSSLKNMERSEMIRKQLRYTKIPILRNRKRSLFFGESDLDTFGPGSAALGPPAEMTDGEIEGRLELDPERDLKIDLMQSFPVQK